MRETYLKRNSDSEMYWERYSIQVFFPPEDVEACFIDYQKAFSRIQHNKLVQELLQLLRMINTYGLSKNFYYNQKSHVIGKKSEAKAIRRDVRQSYVFVSTLIFIQNKSLMRPFID